MIHARPPEIPHFVSVNKKVFKGDMYALAEVLTSFDIKRAIAKRQAETEKRRDAIWNNDKQFDYEKDFE